MHPHQYAKIRDGSQPVHEAPENDRVPVHMDERHQGSPRAGPPALDDDCLLTAKQTQVRCGNVTAMCIWRWMRDPRVMFPAPIQINRRNYWRLGDLRRWQAERSTSKAA
jgi:hypothetical protein